MAPHRPIDQAICAISGLLGYFSRMTVSSPSRSIRGWSRMGRREEVGQAGPPLGRQKACTCP